MDRSQSTPGRDFSGPKLATRLAFLAAGFSMACWAPLIPFAKARVGADDGQLGLILLCLGIGSILAMPLTGWLTTRWGSKPMIVSAGLGLCLILPWLAVAKEIHWLAMALLGFGAAIGTIDVAMNVHAVEVERESKQQLMSGFHAMYSAGGIVGAGYMTFLLTKGVAPFAGAAMASGLTLVAVLLAWPRFLPAKGQIMAFVMPHGIVLLLAGLAAATFLVEGAILDWGALLVIDAKIASAAHAGLGYMLFSVAMTLGRLTGDKIVSRIGNRTTLLWGGSTALLGFVVLLTFPSSALAMTGFFIIGLGASNIVPIFFRLAGTQSVMPAGMAVAALTTTGYAGILVGPAAMGFISRLIGLPSAFWLLAVLMACVPLTAFRLTRGENPKGGATS